MLKRISVIGLTVLMIISLVGCDIENRNTKNEIDEPITFLSASENIISEESKESVIVQNSTETEALIELSTTTKLSVDNSTKTELNVDSTTTEKKELKPVITENTKPSKPKEDEKVEVETKPISKPEKETKPETKPKPEVDKPIETKPVEQAFDIDYWINYSKGYATSIGLELDSQAIECWDNPITANNKRVNLESEIKSRLNRYKDFEGFTAVWVWALKVSESEYDLYIGYA